MGCGTWSSDSWKTYKKESHIDDSSSVTDLYSNSAMDDSMNPKDVMRESRDSEEHPNSNSIILGLDVTGSMGKLAEEIAKYSLNTLITDIYNNKIIEDPQILIAAIGDSYYDDCPLQVSQFESDIRIAKELQKIYFEGGGGGNDGESYLLLYYFAARHTDIDCLKKRNKKGVIYTIGDEPCVDCIPKEHIKAIFGDDVQSDIMFDDIFEEVSKSYDVFHIIANGWHHDESVHWWKNHIGQRAIFANDISKIPQIINTTLELRMGKSLGDAVSKYDQTTAVAVVNSLKDLALGEKSNGELVEFD